MKQILSSLLTTEEEARNIIKKAIEEAEQKITDSKKAIDDLLAKAKQTMDEKKIVALTNAETEVSEEVKKIKENGDKAVSELGTAAKSKKASMKKEMAKVILSV